MTFYVYRAFDRTGDLLYVGSTADPQTRFRQHRHDNPHWALDVCRWRIAVFPDRESARTAELSLIRTEHPYWNIAGRWINHLEWEPKHYIRWVHMLRAHPYSHVATKQRIAMALLCYRTRFASSMPSVATRRKVSA